VSGLLVLLADRGDHNSIREFSEELFRLALSSRFKCEKYMQGCIPAMALEDVALQIV